MQFIYKKTFDWHFCYCHIADDHNNLQHSSPASGETWITTQLTICILTFLLAITEVNLYLVMIFLFGRRMKRRMQEPTLILTKIRLGINQE